ncbi:hypothetical protein ZIOFF_033035 [Zingiber officinale]|uniref:Secreted protein n=1 Tax=Zingiber officinale TaxID=94328 RepID=A0A8J5GXZ8_ZINOF|nr:hypothetical protein ZIOFF_033035 [Zingiber officinale]
MVTKPDPSLSLSLSLSIYLLFCTAAGSGTSGEDFVDGEKSSPQQAFAAVGWWLSTAWSIGTTPPAHDSLGCALLLLPSGGLLLRVDKNCLLYHMNLRMALILSTKDS